VSHDD
jgi:hypothetical protein